jgi:hypothetical protein
MTMELVNPERSFPTYDTPNAPVRIETSPQEHLDGLLLSIRGMLTNLGTLRNDIAGSEALNLRGESECKLKVDVARDMLTALYGTIQLLLDKHAQTVADFGRTDSKAPF